MIFKCIAHNIGVQIDGKRRVYITPRGSYAGMPRCRILIEEFPVVGKASEDDVCEIEKIDQGNE